MKEDATTTTTTTTLSPKNNNNNSDQNNAENNDMSPTTTANKWNVVLTNARETMTPYLPPPVVSVMRRIDSELSSTVVEPSMTILSCLLLAALIWKAVTVVLKATSAKRSTLHDEDRDHVLSHLSAANKHNNNNKRADKFDETVLLFGPSNAGKTALFYTLTSESTTTTVTTVTSLKANVAVLDHVRIIDYPGHASLLPSLYTLLPNVTRAVLVLDSTAPVAEGADILYQVLQSSHSNDDDEMKVLVACTKRNSPRAKNWKRIKIQLRTELERITKSNNNNNDQESPNVDGSSFSFVSLDIGLGMEELKAFVWNGIIFENEP